MESSSYRTRSVGCRSREPRAPTEGPRGPTSPFPPPLNPAGRMLRTSEESRSTRRKLRGADALLRDHLLPRPSPPQYLYQGASLHGGVGEGLRGHAPLRAATPSRASDRTRGYRTPPPFAPHSGQPRVCSQLLGWEDWLEGGLPCGERRHGRSCSVNESKCLGDRGLPGSRHAKGGGGGGDKRAGGGGREEGKKARAAATASQPGMCTSREERDQRDLKQPEDWRGEGASQPVESSRRGGGLGFLCDFSGLVGFIIIIIFKFPNPARGREREISVDCDLLPLAPR